MILELITIDSYGLENLVESIEVVDGDDLVDRIVKEGDVIELTRHEPRRLEDGEVIDEPVVGKYPVRRVSRQILVRPSGHGGYEAKVGCETTVTVVLYDSTE